MFEALITQVLNKVLGDFIENIDSNQLDISLMNGNVNLANMKLKSNIFESLPVPFALDYGQIGQINLQIPVWNMFNQPLMIEIKDVFAVVRPKHIKEWNEEVEQKAYKESNQSYLDKYEVFNSTSDSLLKKDPSSIEKLVTKIIDNIEITIKNIYIRYEDSYSAPNQGSGKFAIGILLKEFSTHTTSTDWLTKAMSIGEEITHKLAKLKNFSLFLDFDSEFDNYNPGGPLTIGQIKNRSISQKEIDYDLLLKDTTNKAFIQIINNEFENKDVEHNYIIDNFSMEARLKLNKNPILNQQPQLLLDLLLGGTFKKQAQEKDINIKWNIHQPQIIRILKLIEYIGYFNEFQKGALAHIGRKVISQQLANEYIRLYCEWRMLKDNKKTHKEAAEKRTLMKVIEEDYPADKILVVRKFAQKVLEQQQQQTQEEQELEKKVKEMESKTKGWGIFTSKEKKQQQQQEVDEFRRKLREDFQGRTSAEKSELDQELQQLTDDLAQQQTFKTEDFDKMPPGYMRFKVKLAIPCLQFSFINEFDQHIFISQIHNQQALLDIGKGVTKINFQLSAIKLQDLWTGAKSFPNIIDTIDVEGTQTDALQAQTQTQALIVDFEQNDAFTISPVKLKIVTQKTLFIVANFHFIKEIKRSMLNALKGEKLDFSYYKEAATEKALQFVKSGKEFLENIKKGEYTHQALDATLSLNSPTIVIPENIFKPQRSCMVIETGKIELKSDLVGHNKGIDYKILKSPSSIYDKYQISLSHFQINMLENGLENSGILSYKRDMGEQVIKEFNASITFFNCVEPMHPLFPTAELDILIKNFDLQIGTKFIENIMKIQNAVLEQLASKEERIFEQVALEKKPTLQELLGEELWKKIRDKESSEKQQELKDQSVGTIENPADEEDEDFAAFLDADMTEEEIYKYRSTQARLSDTTTEEYKKDHQQEGLCTSFKVYFNVDKFQIMLFKEAFNYEKKALDKHELINILMLHFGIEVDIDRKQDVNVTLGIFKFLIEDIHRNSEISIPFRMILSSPMVEFVRPSYLDEDKNQFTEYSGGVMPRSLTTLTYNVNEDDMFQDAVDDEAKLAQQQSSQPNQKSQNEFDLSIKISGPNIDINAALSDMRFIFSVPTAQSLLDLAISLQQIFQNLEKEKLQERKAKLQMYEYVLSRICNQFEDCEQNLVQRIFINIARQNKLDPEVGQVLYQEGIQRLYLIWDMQEEQTERDTMVSETDSSMSSDSNTTWVAKIKRNRLHEKLEIVESQLSIVAKLNNFSVWIPLQPENESSQVLSISFQQELRVGTYGKSENTLDVTLNETIKKEQIDSQTALSFTMSNLMIQIIESEDFMNLVASGRQSMFNAGSSGYEEFSLARMLEPSRLALSLSSNVNNKINESKTLINIDIEPLAFKIGFKHIDFINIILAQVMESLDYIKQLTSQTQSLDSDRQDKKDEIKDLKEEVKTQEKKIEDNKCFDVKRVTNFKKHRRDNQPKHSTTSIEFKCGTITLSLNDDQNLNDQPLVYAKIQNLSAQIKLYETDDDAATFMLKKLGIWQRNNQDLVQDQQCKQITANFGLFVDYYNARSLSFEPLIEPWYLIMTLSQLAPYTEQNIKLKSDRPLNINMTFGMAYTIRRLMDRIVESFTQASILEKIKKGQQVNTDEIQSSKAWKMALFEKKQIRASEVNDMMQSGFIFQNFTGIDVKACIHDELIDEDIEYQVDLTKQDPKNLEKSLVPIPKSRIITLEGEYSNRQVTKSYNELNQYQKEILLRRNRGQVIEFLQEDPLRIDLKLNGIDKIQSVPIEGLGIYSYRTTFIPQNQVKTGRKILPFSFKKKTQAQTVGIIANIKMDGNFKKVTLESQLIIANNLKRPISLYVKHNKQEEYQVKGEFRTIIDPDQVFRVPITWIFNSNPDLQNSLYIEAKALSYCLFKNVDEMFTDILGASKLQQSDSKLVRLEADYFCSVDIAAYKCLPKKLENGPPQYLVSFNSPLMISNYNFQPLEIRDPTNHDYVYTMMGPRETAFINMIDGYDLKPDIEWVFYENYKDTISHITRSFDIGSRLQVDKKIEKFSNHDKKNPRIVRILIEVKKIHHQDIAAYDGENFEMRDRLKDFICSAQVLLYPNYMIINRTSLPISIDKQTILPQTNEYLSVDHERLAFRVQGFKPSLEYDINTVGLAGALQLDLDIKDQVIKDCMPQKEYIPDRLELGMMIYQAPNPFNKTTLITFLPRYIIVNQIGTPIVLRQKGASSQILLKNTQTAFNFEKSKNEKDRFLLIREASYDEQFSISQGKGLYVDRGNIRDDREEAKYWSTPFSIDDIDDFQISYPKETGKDQEEVWYMPNADNGYMRFIRVIVTTQNDATIIIALTNPVMPEYEIHNKTNTEIEVAQSQGQGILAAGISLIGRQNDEKRLVGDFTKVPSKVLRPYAWVKRTEANRLAAVKIGGTVQHINIDKAMRRYEFKATNKQSYYVEVKIVGSIKKLKISEKTKEDGDFVKAKYLQDLLKKHYGAKLNVGLDLKGIGISFIDETPEELLFLSLYDIKIQLQQWNEDREDGSRIEQVTQLKLFLKHMQIDNMINQVMPVILAPTKPLKKPDREQTRTSNLPSIKELEESKEESKTGDAGYTMVTQDDDETPFIQTIIQVAESFGHKEKVSQKRLRTLQFSIQEFVFQIETSIINSNVKFVVELISLIAKDKIYKLILANSDSFEKAKYQRRDQICDELDASRSLVNQDQNIQANKMFVDLIHLGAIKAIITFKLEKKAVELDVTDPERGFGMINILYPLLAGVASISESPLSFNELIMLDTFAQPDMLVQQIQKTYQSQGIRQIYKLIGSSDMIGNPMGLVDKLGTGVYQFVSEPAKGLLKGPDQFVGGVGKGVQGLVTNVVSGGFGSVSKITGSLYTVVKNVSGEKNVQIQKSEGVGDGLKKGVQGGVSELVGGVTGLFTKPIQKTREEGAKGFFKGLGSGLVGAIASPITATLRVGTSVAQGVSASANTVGQIGKEAKLDTYSLYSRFRPPRHINSRHVITPFNMDLAMVSQILSEQWHGRYVDQTIRDFALLPLTKNNGEASDADPKSSILIITDEMLLYLRIEKDGPKKGRPHPMFKSRLRKVKSCDVYKQAATDSKGNKLEVYILSVGCYSVVKGSKKYAFMSSDYSKFEKFYQMLSILPTCDAYDKVKGVKSQAAAKISEE